MYIKRVVKNPNLTTLNTSFFVIIILVVLKREKEKCDLLPLPSKEIRKKYHLTLNEVTVSNESLISYKSNKYSVPKKYIGLKVGLAIVRDTELHIYYNEKS